MTVQSPTFIFDIGGVLIRHDNDLLYDRLAACCADPAAARPHLPTWLHEDIGTGRLGIDALHASLVTDHGFNETYTRFLDLWSSHFSEEPGMEPVIYTLAQLYRVVLFSNTNAAHLEHIRANYPVLGYAHAGYMSHELGLVKPHTDSYHRVLELEGRPPEDCIFIDDRAENTAAAAEIGIRTITFRGRDAFLKDLAGYGVTFDLRAEP